MTGLDQFLSLVGGITVSKIVAFILAAIFCWKIYLQVQKFFDNKKDLLLQKHEAEQEKDKKLQMALDEVAKYPKYREQSRKIQQEFRKEIDGLKEAQSDLSNTQQEICQTLVDMKATMDKRERNKTRDRLLQMYRYYTSEKTNPSHSWTKMEAEAFWELFGDYEEAGGDGYMHEEVQPEMNKLDIIE